MGSNPFDYVRNNTWNPMPFPHLRSMAAAAQVPPQMYQYQYNPAGYMPMQEQQAVSSGYGPQNFYGPQYNQMDGGQCTSNWSHMPIMSPIPNAPNMPPLPANRSRAASPTAPHGSAYPRYNGNMVLSNNPMSPNMGSPCGAPNGFGMFPDFEQHYSARGTPTQNNRYNDIGNFDECFSFDNMYPMEPRFDPTPNCYDTDIDNEYEGGVPFGLDQGPGGHGGHGMPGMYGAHRGDTALGYGAHSAQRSMESPGSHGGYGPRGYGTQGMYGNDRPDAGYGYYEYPSNQPPYSIQPGPSAYGGQQTMGPYTAMGVDDETSESELETNIPHMYINGRRVKFPTDNDNVEK